MERPIPGPADNKHSGEGCRESYVGTRHSLQEGASTAIGQQGSTND